MTQPSTTCGFCGATSFNPHDVANGYCGRCHNYVAQINRTPEVGLTITTEVVFGCGKYNYAFDGYHPWCIYQVFNNRRRRVVATCLSESACRWRIAFFEEQDARREQKV